MEEYRASGTTADRAAALLDSRSARGVPATKRHEQRNLRADFEGLKWSATLGWWPPLDGCWDASSTPPRFIAEPTTFWSKPGVNQTGVIPWASFGPSPDNLVFDVTNSN